MARRRWKHSLTFSIRLAIAGSSTVTATGSKKTTHWLFTHLRSIDALFVRIYNTIRKRSMALHGKLILNGADYAPFNLYGVGVFMAFSGNGIYRNKGACGAVKGDLAGSFQEERQIFRIHGAKFATVLSFHGTNGSLYIRMIGVLMTEPRLIAYTVDCSGYIPERYQRVVLPLLITQIMP